LTVPSTSRMLADAIESNSSGRPLVPWRKFTFFSGS
jgi:hypothetical protein